MALTIGLGVASCDVSCLGNNQLLFASWTCFDRMIAFLDYVVDCSHCSKEHDQGKQPSCQNRSSLHCVCLLHAGQMGTSACTCFVSLMSNLKTPSKGETNMKWSATRYVQSARWDQWVDWASPQMLTVTSLICSQLHTDKNAGCKGNNYQRSHRVPGSGWLWQCPHL